MGNCFERKYSLHSNEVSLSTMRLGRGREWAVKKAKIEALIYGLNFTAGYCTVLVGTAG
jgi:hypothetical protein